MLLETGHAAMSISTKGAALYNELQKDKGE